METSNVGELIRNYRIEHDLTERDLAQKLFVSTCRVMRWERNLSMPNGKVRYALARLLKVDPDTFARPKLHRESNEMSLSAGRITKLRIMTGLSQVQLAQALHVGKGTVANWEVGTRTPRLPEVFAMAKLFHRRLDYILGYSIDDSYYDYDEEHLR